MATRRVPCECFGQMVFDPDAADAADRRRCHDCGARTPPGKWRCVPCQALHDVEAERFRESLREAIAAARREESRRVHGEDDRGEYAGG